MSEPATALVCARCGDLLADEQALQFGADRYCVGCAPAGAVEHRDLRFEAEYVFVGRAMVLLSVLGLALIGTMLVVLAIGVRPGAAIAAAPAMLALAAVLGVQLAIGVGLSRLKQTARLAAAGGSILATLTCVLVAFASAHGGPLVLAALPVAAAALFTHPRAQRVTSPEYAQLLAPELAPATNPRPFPRSCFLVIPIVAPIALLTYAFVVCGAIM